MKSNKYQVKITILFFAYSLGVTLFTSCKKLIEIDPPVNNLVESNVFTTDATAISVLNGIYNNMTKINGVGDFTGSSSLSVLVGLSSDELTLHKGIVNIKHPRYYRNNLSAQGGNVAGSEFWQSLYPYIYKCNAAIEGLNSDKAEGTLSSVVKQQLLGEAKFMRAFFLLLPR